jgi:DNA-binding transcriptional MerR regulator
MDWQLPGTVLKLPREDAARVEEIFSTMFLAGGLVLSQVAELTGLEPHTVQNWVKRGFLSPPERKRYSLRQLCRILNINAFKGILSMDRICGMLRYVNGKLDDYSDDIIDDSKLYFMFVGLAARIRELSDEQAYEKSMKAVLEEYNETVVGNRERVETVLRIMLTAYAAARMQQQAENMLSEIERS